MKLLDTLVFFYGMFFMSFTGHAQKETFDIVSYTLPNGWQTQQVEGGVQLFVTDNKTGDYAIAIVTKAMVSAGSATEDFNSQWKSLLANTVNAITDPVMIAPVHDDGWEIHSGNGNYIDGATKGLATLITATGYNQTTAVVLMTNTQQYQNELLAFINSLSLEKKQKAKDTPVASSTMDADSSSLVGLWCSYRNETSGFMNGVPMYSGGYFRREYALKADGTYLFRSKDWSTTMKEILFVYETGKWVANGNKLTLTPVKGKGEWWSKAPGGRTAGWGKLVKASTWKMEPITYTFDLHYFAGTNETHLILQNSKGTERDGGSTNNEWSYSARALDKSLIDNPPGTKTGFEKK